MNSIAYRLALAAVASLTCYTANAASLPGHTPAGPPIAGVLASATCNRVTDCSTGECIEAAHFYAATQGGTQLRSYFVPLGPQGATDAQAVTSCENSVASICADSTGFYESLAGGPIRQIDFSTDILPGHNATVVCP